MIYWFRHNLLLRLVVLSPLCVSLVLGQQLPSGATLQAGNAKVNYHNSSLYIRQSTERAVIDWQSFNVGEGGAVHFIQPSQSAATLNRVKGVEASQILGQITAPGQVFITNGNGIYFGESSSVDVGSLAASTLAIGVEDFMAENLKFTSFGKDQDSSLINEGELRAKENGFIALLAPEVRNEGFIFAKKGTVALASGEMIELQTDPNHQLVGVRVEPAQWHALVENKKVIEADDGIVVLSAQAASSLFQGLVRNSGILQARGIKKDGGRVILTAGIGGQVNHNGLIDSSSDIGKGGLVTMEGEEIELAENSVIDVKGKKGGGDVLIGGDWQGGANQELRVLDDPHALLQAREILMNEGSLINASASGNGDGGAVVLWSDIFDLESKTLVNGEIYANGGMRGGDGGSVETSGHFLDINDARVSTLAPFGQTGDWLLDPGNIDITNTGTSSTDNLPSFPVASTSSIHPSSIVNALASTSVTIQTGTGDYDLTVASAITSTANNSLTLEAGRNIVINANIDVGAGALAIEADNDITVGANLTTSNSGNTAIVLNAGKNDASATSTGGDIIISGSPSISTGAGGRATFYTGSVSGSTGLTTLIGSGTGRFRYNSDESSTNYSTSLSSGKFAIYREQPTVNLGTTSITYGDYKSGDSFPILSVTSGTENGDDVDSATYSITGASYTTNSSGQYLNVKTPTTALEGNANANAKTGSTYSVSTNLHDLGYDVSGGGLQVNPKTVNLIATAVYDGNKFLDSSYDDSDSSTSYNDPSNSNEVTISGLIGNESLRYSTAKTYNYHVASDVSRRFINSITLIDATDSIGITSNYQLPNFSRASGVNQVTITAQPLTLSLDGSTVTSKTYDGTTDRSSTFAPVWNFGSSLVEGDESASISYANAIYSSADAGSGKTLTISGLTINSLSETASSSDQSPTSYPTDYLITINGSPATSLIANSVTINQAALSVTANDSFKFKDQSDPVGFAGLSYSGFVNNENSLVLTGSTSLSRVAGETAADYTLTPDVSGVSSTNYSITAVNGTFTIVPANQLLVTMGSATSNVYTSVYGNAATYSVYSVSYLDSGASTQTISSGSGSSTFTQIADSNNQVTVRDGSSNDIVFTISPSSAANSTANFLKVGSYLLGPTSITNNGSLFSNTVKVIGSHSVSALSLTPTVTGGKTKIYDGDPDLESLTIGLTGLKTGDLVNVAAVGTYRDSSDNPDKNVEVVGSSVVDKAFKVENISITDGGTNNDDANYVLSANILTETDGRINQKPITYLPAQKVYDGTNDLRPVIDGQTYGKIKTNSVRTADGLGLINNEVFTYNAANSTSKHVNGPDDDASTIGLPSDPTSPAGTDTDNFISSVTMVVDGGGSGFIPTNYELPTLSRTTAPVDITKATVKLSGTKVYDSTDTLSSVTVATGITGESLLYSGATSATEDVGTTYVNAITLLDAADANSNESGGSYNPTGFGSDYTFNNALSSGTDGNNEFTIQTKALTVSGITTSDKIYDGLTSATTDFASASFSGLVSGDVLSISSVTGTFDSKDVSITGSTINDKTVTLATTYNQAEAGSDFANYTITDQPSAQSKINQRPLSFVATKTYDGSATITHSDVNSGGLGNTGDASNSGLVGSETLNYSATSNSKDVSVANKYISAITLSDGSNGGLTDNYKVPSGNLGSYNSGLNAVTIDRKTVSLSANKVYDGQTSLSNSAVSVTTGVGSETLTYSGASVNNKDVGTASKFIDAITLADASDASGGLAANYQLPTLNYANAPVTISAKALTMSGLTSANKEYDGTTTAVVSGGPGSLQGAISAGSGSDNDGKPYSGDTVSLTGTAVGTFNDKDVADATTVVFSGVSLTGSEAGNYSLTAHADATGLSITPKPMTISGLYAYNNTYNGRTNVYIFNSTIVMSGLVTIDGVADDVTGGRGWNGTMADAHVGNGKSVTISSTFSGADVGNYNITDQATTTVNISPKEVTLSASKVYDGTTSLGAGVITISGTVYSETIGYNSATSNSMDVSGNRYIDAITLVDGTGLASNYTTPDLTTYSATKNSVTITAKPLTISGLSSSDKVFDATTNATVNGTAVLQSPISAGSGSDSDGIPYSGDGIALSGTATGTFDSANVGSRSVSFGGLSLTGSGSKADNYSLTAHATASQSISERAVFLSATKVYDGDNTLTGAEVTLTTNTGETLNYSGATSSDANVATTNKFISSITLENNGGALASNYSLPTLNFANAPVTISSKSVQLSASKTYDGNNDLTGNVTLSTGVGSETLSYSGATASSRNVTDANKFISAITILDATDGSGGLNTNYNLPSLDAANAPVTISAKAITMSGLTSSGKIYDGTTNATVAGTASLQSAISAGTGSASDGKPYDVDSVSITGTAVGTYNDKDVFDASTVAFSGLSLTGSGSGNYSLSNHADASHTISVKPVSVSGLTSSDKIYDGTTNATVGGTASLQSAISAGTGSSSDGKPYDVDSLSLAGTAVGAFNDKDVSDATKVVFSGLSLTGTGEENYSFTNHPDASHSVNTKEVSLSGSKTYDGGVDLMGAVSLLTGVGSETLSYSGASASAKDVSVSHKYINGLTLGDATDGSGGLAGNYQLPSLDAVNAPVSIGTREVSLSGSKTYDGGVNLTGSDVSISTGVGSETLSYSGATVSAKDVTVSNKYIDAITLENATDGSGGLAGNYQLPSLDTVNAPVSIVTKEVSLSGSKTYDGGVNLTGSDVSISTGVGSETLFYSSASSSSKDVAVSNKYIDAITLENALDGSGGLSSNYQLPVLDRITAPVTIGAKTVSLSASKIYDAGVDLAGYVSLNTGVASETLSYSGAISNSKDVAPPNKYIESISLEDGVDGSGGLESNYQLPSLNASNAPVTIEAKTVSLSANRVYDGSVGLTGTDVSIETGFGLETLSYSGASVNSKDVAVSNKFIDAITLENATDESGGLSSNYQLPSLDALNSIVSITPKVVELSANKIYDALLSLSGSDLTIKTGVGEETLSYSEAMASAKDVAVTGNYITSITLNDANDGSGGFASNYLLPTLDALNAPVDIEPSSLIIQAFDEVKTYGRDAVLDENNFEVKGLQGTDEVTYVSLQSEGRGTNADLGYYNIVPSNARGPNFDPYNYDIDYLYGVLIVEASPFEQKTALVSIETVQNKVSTTESSSVETVDTSTFSTITPTSIGPPAPTFITAPPSFLPVTPVVPSTPTPTPEPSSVPATPEPTPALTPEPASTLAPEPTSTPEAAPTPTTTSAPVGDSVTPTQSNTDPTGSSSDLTVDLLDTPDTSTVGLIAVSVPRETTTTGTGFSFELPEEISTMSQQQEVSVEVTLETGAPLPDWLSYQEDTGKFTSASVPNGAFPITVIMKIGSQQVAVVISERQE